MIYSIYKMALLGVIFSTSMFLSYAQSINGARSVNCGSFRSYSISPPTGNISNFQCSGVWHITYPNGNTTALSGTQASVNWGSTPGSGSVSFQGSCTYTITTSNQNGNNPAILGSNNNQTTTTTVNAQVNQTISVSVGNGRMPKPYLYGPGHFCVNQTKTFSISSIANAVNYTYVAPSGWSINGGSNTLTTSALSVSITSPSTGSTSTVFIKVRTNGPNCVMPSAYAAKTVRFGPTNPSIVGNSVVSGNSYNEYFGVNTQGLVGGTWSTPSSWTVAEDYGVSSQVFQVPSSGSGYVVLSGTSCGVSVSATKLVTISSGGSGGGPIFVGPKSLTNDIDDVIESKEFDVTVYPNPSNDQLNFQSIGGEIALVQLLNTSGQLVFEQLGAERIDVTSVSSGLYFVQFTGMNGEEVIEKIEIRH